MSRRKEPPLERLKPIELDGMDHAHLERARAEGLAYLMAVRYRPDHPLVPAWLGLAYSHYVSAASWMKLARRFKSIASMNGPDDRQYQDEDPLAGTVPVEAVKPEPDRTMPLFAGVE